MADYYSELRKRFIEVKERKKLTYKEVSKRSNAHHSCIQMWATQKHTLSDEAASKIAKWLDMEDLHDEIVGTDTKFLLQEETCSSAREEDTTSS